MQNSVSKASLWAGRIVSGLTALFLLLDGVMKLFKPAFVVEATVRLGYLESVIILLGIVLVVHDPLFDSCNIYSRRDLVDWLSRWRGGDARARQ